MDKINSQQFYGYNTPLQFCSMNGNSECFIPQNQSQRNTSDFVTSEISSASRAYGLSVINKNKTLPQMSLQDLVKCFESQGKVKGKDFEIDSYGTMGNTVVTLKNKNGKPNLCIHYDMGNHNTWNCYESYKYKNGEIDKVVERNAKGEIFCTTKYFKSNDVKHLDPYISCTTTPTEYIKHLQESGINYSVSYDDETKNDKNVYVDILDTDNKLKDTVCFLSVNNKLNKPTGIIVKRNYNKQGEEIRRITYDADNVGITTYFNV